MYSFQEVFSSTASTSTHKTLGKDIEEVIKDFSNVVFDKNAITNNIKKICVCLPGNFQPFHNGHLVTYKLLRKLFGDDSIFILPSAQRIFPNNPLTFEQRKKLILNSRGLTLHPNHIKQRRSKGFKHLELAKDIGISNQLSEYIFITVLSIEDSLLMPTEDKVTYYQPYPAELYDINIDKLRNLTRFLPSMDKYGFKFTVDAFGSEILYDFGKKEQSKFSLIKNILFNISIEEVREQLEFDQLKDLEKVLPYDPKLLYSMKEFFINNNYDYEKEQEEKEDKLIDMKKDLVQQLNEKEVIENEVIENEQEKSI